MTVIGLLGTRVARVLMTFVGALAALAVAGGQAAAQQPAWQVTQQQHPTHAVPGERVTIVVAVDNVSTAWTSGPVSVTVDLPDDVTVTSGGDGFFWSCPDATGQSQITCALGSGNQVNYGPDVVPLGETAKRLEIAAEVTPDFVAGDVSVTVSGGGAPDATSTKPLRTGAPPASFGISDFFGWMTDSSGSPSIEAGSHPDVTAQIDFNTVEPPAGSAFASADNLRDVDVDLPPGLVGNPTAVPTCPMSKLADPTEDMALCPPETQVGMVRVMHGPGASSEVPLYNVEPPEGSPGRLAFNAASTLVIIEPGVRTGGDYGIVGRVRGSSQSLSVVSARVTIWGVPADPIHDHQRYVVHQVFGPYPGNPSAAPRRPFLTAPTACAGAFEFGLGIASWADPGSLHRAAFSSNRDGSELVVGNCTALPFDPGFELRPASQAGRGAPVGIGVDLSVPQVENPDGVSSSHLRKVAVTLPEGMVVNPSSAQGLQACSPEQIALGSDAAPSCPAASRLGSVEVATPLLKEPLNGGVYLASQRDNPFETTLAMYIVAEGSGVVVKLPGRIDPDPVTGRVTATFDDNPQLPFDRLSMRLKAGPRAALSLPTRCGPATTQAVLAPWSGTDPVAVESTFEVSADGSGGACQPVGFAPSFTAGVANPTAGGSSPFVLAMGRGDEDEELSRATIDMPDGLLARVGAVDTCADSAAAAGTCGQGSLIGRLTSAAGAGPNPLTLPGRVYLTDSYKGGAYGMSFVVPALAGPFDLGTVVVRAAVHIDPETAAIRVVSDPMPRILEGIPLQVRLVDVAVDRPNFVVNPTSCRERQVAGTLVSGSGTERPVASRFQVGDCAALPFKPRLAMRVSGRRQTKTGGHPALSATLTQAKGQANTDKATVTLPKSIVLDPTNTVDPKMLCGYDESLKVDCPASTVIGRATARTPLLRRPLVGDVHLVQGIKFGAKGNRIRTTPSLLVKLRGEVAINLRARSNVRNGRLVTTFPQIPDAPVSKFSMRINGGKKGVLVVTRTRRAKIDICAGRQTADVELDGQNGKRADYRTTVKTPCASKAARKAKRKSGRR